MIPVKIIATFVTLLVTVSLIPYIRRSTKDRVMPRVTLDFIGVACLLTSVLMGIWL